MLTIPSPLVHSKDEHNIAILLSKAATQYVAALQEKLVQTFGDAIWLQQPPALHVTVMEIICDAEYRDKTRAEHFAQWYQKYNRIVHEVLSTCPPFDIMFDQLIVSQGAIIIKASDTSALNAIRVRLLERISLPEGTKQPPGITHCTLARYTRPINLDDATRLTGDTKVKLIEHVDHFSLIKDLGPPDFNGMPLDNYSLAI